MILENILNNLKFLEMISFDNVVPQLHVCMYITIHIPVRKIEKNEQVLPLPWKYFTLTHKKRNLMWTN